MPSYRESLISKMNKFGFIYDEIESSPRNLRFFRFLNPNNKSEMMTVTCKSWKEVNDYVDGLIKS